jgi:hypothetical protein
MEKKITKRKNDGYTIKAVDIQSIFYISKRCIHYLRICIREAFE